LGLLEPSMSDDTIMENMLQHPILVNRPIVCRYVKRFIHFLCSPLFVYLIACCVSSFLQSDGCEVMSTFGEGVGFVGK
jgi:ArsC family